MTELATGLDVFGDAFAVNVEGDVLEIATVLGESLLAGEIVVIPLDRANALKLASALISFLELTDEGIANG
jgi:hypothetical protein